MNPETRDALRKKLERLWDSTASKSKRTAVLIDRDKLVDIRDVIINTDLPKEERIKDYIAKPKHSSYQSLHITRVHDVSGLITLPDEFKTFSTPPCFSILKLSLEVILCIIMRIKVLLVMLINIKKESLVLHLFLILLNIFLMTTAFV